MAETHDWSQDPHRSNEMLMGILEIMDRRVGEGVIQTSTLFLVTNDLMVMMTKREHEAFTRGCEYATAEVDILEDVRGGANSLTGAFAEDRAVNPGKYEKK
jgi:hypothetical protein